MKDRLPTTNARGKSTAVLFYERQRILVGLSEENEKQRCVNFSEKNSWKMTVDEQSVRIKFKSRGCLDRLWQWSGSGGGVKLF